MNLIDMCTNPYTLRVMYILGLALKIVCIIVPIIIIGTTILKTFNVIVSGKEDNLKELLPFFIKKIIAGLIVFLIPTIINFSISLVGDNSYEVNLCETNANLETITYYETLLPIEQKIQNLESHPTKNNLEAAEKAVSGVTGYAKEDTMLDYRQRITAAKNSIDVYNKRIECRNKGGQYIDGYCRIPIKEEFGGSSNDEAPDGNCVCCGKESVTKIYFGKQY